MHSALLDVLTLCEAALAALALQQVVNASVHIPGVFDHRVRPLVPTRWAAHILLLGHVPHLLLLPEGTQYLFILFHFCQGGRVDSTVSVSYNTECNFF